ncbi:MAG: hypothetical protein LBP80_08360 [Treponema sp.]|nr:hypothetical protein [Treponema sp.]
MKGSARFIEANQEGEMLEYIQNVFHRLRKLRNYTAVHNAFIDFLSSGKAIREKYRLNNQTALNESKFEYAAFYDLLFIGDVELYIKNLFLELLLGKQSGGITYSFIVKKALPLSSRTTPKTLRFPMRRKTRR